MRREKATAEG
jgi:uncharacterized protein (DUF1015 family)